MTKLAIRAEGVGKLYQIGRQPSHNTLRDALAAFFSTTLRRRGNSERTSLPAANRNGPNTFWALRNISFDVKQGEVVGIIGRNGAGKSTLLKILSRITEPTTGAAEIHGRVGSLLEVGTGFHDELSGRENVYLGGAIMGMKKAEINRRFDEIVAFAELEKFIDTPVKHYSSGMYTRLAFAVAAHLEPEILIVDEVLSVGDIAFQKKCLGKIGDEAREGRTVLFVSHNIGVVQSLCTRAILLDQGSIVIDASPCDAISRYLQAMEEAAEVNLLMRTRRWGRGEIRFSKIEITTADASRSTTLTAGRPARFSFHITGIRPRMTCSFTIYDHTGHPVTYFDSAVYGPKDSTDPDKGAQFNCDIDELLLIPGRYRINTAIMCNGEMEDHLEAAAFFDVEQGLLNGRPVPRDTGYGSVLMHHRWVTPAT